MPDGDGLDPPTLLPLPPRWRRPENGFIAWQVTLGYINQHHSPDARLKLEAYPVEQTVLWQGTVSWGTNSESVTDQPSLSEALRMLWLEVDRYHQIFGSATEDEQDSRPSGFADTEWLDLSTQDVLHRLLWMISTAFKADWRLVLVYQPAEVPAERVQMRLALPTGTSAGGRGGNLIEALRDGFRNAIPAFADYLGDDGEALNHDTN
jgi:hypothetical protein